MMTGAELSHRPKLTANVRGGGATASPRREMSRAMLSVAFDRDE